MYLNPLIYKLVYFIASCVFFSVKTKQKLAIFSSKPKNQTNMIVNIFCAILSYLIKIAVIQHVEKSKAGKTNHKTVEKVIIIIRNQ